LSAQYPIISITSTRSRCCGLITEGALITTHIDAARWEAIARDYAANALTITDICALHSVSRSAVHRRALKEGWINRAVMADGPARRRTRQRDLGQRLLDMLDRKMTQIENRAAPTGGAAPTAADAERDARTLNTLVRLFDKLTTLRQKTEAASKQATPAGPAERGDDGADGLRNALAQRLEKLRSAETAEPVTPGLTVSTS
jgi:hypothetical protein